MGELRLAARWAIVSFVDNVMEWPAPRPWQTADHVDAFGAFSAYRAEGERCIAAVRSNSIVLARLVASTTVLEVLHQIPLVGEFRTQLDDALAAFRDYRTVDPEVRFPIAFDVTESVFGDSFAAGAPRERPKRTLAKVKSDLRFLLDADDLDIGSIMAALEWLDRLMWLRHSYTLPGTMEQAITDLATAARGAPRQRVVSDAERLVDEILHSCAATWK